MSIAELYNVPKSVGDLETWSFANAAHHRDIIRVIFQTQGIQLAEFVIDPFSPMDMTWGRLHQVMHEQMDAVLGIAGDDLSDVPWRDQEAMGEWIFSHASQHLQAANILGVA